MPFQSQFSLSLELSKLLPVQSAISHTAESLINLARELRRSGSDILVEEDLAAIFSRGKIVSSVETHFKDVVKVASFTPLHPGSQIILNAGPGPTLNRAFNDRYYMTAVIQLSFLGWIHEITSLASALVESMNKRFQMGVAHATPDPDYDGILKCLNAVQSQTSQYPWEKLVQLVQSKFVRSHGWLRLPHSPVNRLSPNILLAAIDYLYLVQSLPEDRLIVVESQMGLIPLIVWAHYILGLRVLIQDSPDGDVYFGGPGNPQVIIKWAKEPELFEADLMSPPAVYLHDGDMEIILTTCPHDNDAVQLNSEEKHRLEGYGTTFLQRLYNRASITTYDHPIYKETAQFSVAFAISVSKILRRVPFPNQISSPVPPQCSQNTQIWQIKDASDVLFHGIEIDWNAVEGYSKTLIMPDGSWSIPPTVRSYLETMQSDHPFWPKSVGSVISDIKRIASWILAFAQVAEVRDCAQLPLIYEPEWAFCPGIMTWDGKGPVDMGSNFWFSRIIQMLIGQNYGKVSVASGTRLFLVSERGWSLYHGNLGDNDPGSVNCEYLFIKRGVPTNSHTQERRYQISDAPRIRPPAPPKGPAPSPSEIEKSGTYVPRCFTKVVKRTEQYISRSRDFWLSIRYDVEEVWPEGTKRYSLYGSHRQFHEALWGVVRTTPCEHPKNKNGPEQLDLGVVTVKGFDWTVERETKSHRICVCLVKGDSRARWLVLGGIVQDTDEGENLPDGLERRVMLRCDNCCVKCAVLQAGSMDGKWLVIL